MIVLPPCPHLHRVVCVRQKRGQRYVGTGGCRCRECRPCGAAVDAVLPNVCRRGGTGGNLEAVCGNGRNRKGHGRGSTVDGAQRHIVAARGTGVLTPRTVDAPVPVNRKGQRTVAVVGYRNLLVLHQPLRAAAALPVGKGEAVRTGGGCADVGSAVCAKVRPRNGILGIDIHTQRNGGCVCDYVLGNDLYIDVQVSRPAVGAVIRSFGFHQIGSAACHCHSLTSFSPE